MFSYTKFVYWFILIFLLMDTVARSDMVIRGFKINYFSIHKNKKFTFTKRISLQNINGT